MAALERSVHDKDAIIEAKEMEIKHLLGQVAKLKQKNVGLELSAQEHAIGSQMLDESGTIDG